MKVDDRFCVGEPLIPSEVLSCKVVFCSPVLLYADLRNYITFDAKENWGNLSLVLIGLLRLLLHIRQKIFVTFNERRTCDSVCRSAVHEGKQFYEDTRFLFDRFISAVQI